jgi:hypothetical protein
VAPIMLLVGATIGASVAPGVSIVKSFVSNIVNSVGVLVVVINKDGLGNFDSDYQGCKVHHRVLLQ